MDQAITQWINSLADSNVLLDSVMIMATKVGQPLLVVAQWWSKIDRTHVRHTCIAAGLSFLIGLGLNQIITPTVRSGARQSTRTSGTGTP